MAQRLRVPAGPLETAVSLNLKKWSTDKHFPREVFFEAIDSYKATLAKLPYVPIDDEDDDLGEDDESAVDVTAIPELYVRILPTLIDRERSLLGHILKRDDVAIETKWSAYLEAAAWVVLQRYVRECQNGKWPGE